MKRGIGKLGSHVGMMLSFAIFVTFIIFLYSVLSPAINVGEDKSSILSYVETGILKNTSANLTTASVQINKASNKNCIRLDLFFTVLLDVMPTSQNGATVIVKNSLEEEPEAYNDFSSADADLRINRAETSKKENTFFKVYYSSSFTRLEDGTLDCESLSSLGTDPDYTISLVTVDKYMFEKYIVNLTDYYNLDYAALKKSLGVPEGDEFWFNFTKSDGSSISPPEKEVQTTNIFSTDVPIQYVDSNANIQSGFINIKVW